MVRGAATKVKVKAKIEATVRRVLERSIMRVSTQYQVNTYSHICTNPECPDGLPHWKGFGKATRRKCPICGKPLRRIKSEPRGTKHHSP